MEDKIDWGNAYNAREALRPNLKSKDPPQIDKEVSEIVGRPIAVNDPRLVQEVIKWRQFNTSSWIRHRHSRKFYYFPNRHNTDYRNDPANNGH